MSEGQIEAKPEVRIHIDQERYHSPNPTTGEVLYGLGHISSGHELYREVSGDQEDQPVPRTSEFIHLNTDEHFHSGLKEVSVFVNTRKREVKARKLSFDQVVALAFDPVPTGPNIMFTITYRNGPPANLEGSLLEGQKVRIKDRMIFDVTPTDKS
jgi:hypothetical protein